GLRSAGLPPIWRPLEGSVGEAAEAAVPPAPFLVGGQNRRTGSIEAGREAGRGEGHEGDETVDLGFAGEQPGSDASETEGVESKIGTHPVRAGRGDVAFGEHEVEGPEDSAEAIAPCARGRQFEADLGSCERLLRSDDALLDGG